MRSIVTIGILTALVVVLASVVLVPTFINALPAETSQPIENLIYSFCVAMLGGCTFFVAISRYGHKSNSKQIPPAHKTLSLIIAHVIFSYELVLFPLAIEIGNLYGTWAQTLGGAGVLSILIILVSYWLVSLDNRTMTFSDTLSAKLEKADHKLIVGVVFASICLAMIPVMAAISVHLSAGQKNTTADIYSLTQELQQTSNTLRLQIESNEVEAFNETLGVFAGQNKVLTQLTERYADKIDLVAKARSPLPGGTDLQQQEEVLIEHASAWKNASNNTARKNALDQFLHAALLYQTQLANSTKALQAREDKVLAEQRFGQLLKVILSPVVFFGLTFGLIWPLLRLIKAQRYGLEYRRREAEAAMVAKENFLATMSHELRTPMNGMLGMLRLMMNGDLNEKQREQAETALNSGNDLLVILNDILDFTKLERGQMKLEKVPFSPAKLSRDVLRLLSNQADSKGIDLECSVHARVPKQVVGDPTRIRQVMINLVGNAIKFTPQGSVEMKVRYRGNDKAGILKIKVTDTGVGIPKAAQGRIFERFAQADDTITRKFGGTGLGLSICRQLIELMGGQIGVKSTEGFGSTFWFALPVRPIEIEAKPVDDEMADTIVSEPPQEEVEPEKKTNLTILAAEDNPVNQQIVTAFVTAAGHDITVVDNGSEAVEAAYIKDYDVILMDVQMPVMDGMQATRRIRSFQGSRGKIPIVALTANAMEGDRERYLEAGMTDYISKPLNPEKLEEVLNRVLEGDIADAATKRSAETDPDESARVTA
ncbi:MAG: ATP-binding protein [Aquisalinus sp.]|nr:ATP-binding protein [Aquisalinus sp.]